MSKSNALEAATLELWYGNVQHALTAAIAAGAGITPSSPAGNLYVSLTTATPTEAGGQDLNEATYTGYTRAAVPRVSNNDGSTPGWDLSVAGECKNNAQVTFGQNTGSAQELKGWIVGTASSGSGHVLHYGGFLLAQPFMAVVEAAGLAGDTIIAPQHGLVVDDQVLALAALSATLPGGVSNGVYYYVGTKTDDTFTLSTTTGNGNPVNITSVGSLRMGKAQTKTAGNLETPTINPGGIRILEG